MGAVSQRSWNHERDSAANVLSKAALAASVRMGGGSGRPRPLEYPMRRGCPQSRWITLAVAGLALAGCHVDSYFDPSKTGRFEFTPTTIPILIRWPSQVVTIECLNKFSVTGQVSEGRWNELLGIASCRSWFFHPFPSLRYNIEGLTRG